MRIKLNVLTNGTCALIYADAEEHDASWRVEAYDIRAVRIWHNDADASLQIKFNPLKNYDNDYVVTFKSKVPFNEFCENFATSEYNEASNYRYLSHNCASAANYALKIAGIDLPIHWIRLTSLLPSPAWRIPSTILTPYDLFTISKDFKIRSLNTASRPLSTIHFKMDLASSKLLFWAKSSKNAHKNQCVEKIVSAVRQSWHTRQHHAESYLEALIRTSDRLMSVSTHKENKEYNQLTRFFKERAPSKTDQEADQFTNRVALCLFLILVATLVDNQLGNFGLTLPVILLSIFSCGRLLREVETVEVPLYVEDELPQEVDTPLSEAMLEYGIKPSFFDQ